MLTEHADRNGNEFWDGADLVMEVVSEDDPDRDLQTKRDEYAEAGIPEYWIVDPRTKTVTVLKLDRGQYVTHSEARDVGMVRSSLLDGFTADVAAIFAAAGGA
jgi:Uma2 family endonuclease